MRPALSSASRASSGAIGGASQRERLGGGASGETHKWSRAPDAPLADSVSVPHRATGIGGKLDIGHSTPPRGRPVVTGLSQVYA
jgi:hypothetical protein